MTTPKIGSALFIFSFIILWLHVTAMDRLWYFHYPWVDVPLHIFGGVVVALLFLFLYSIFIERDTRSWGEKDIVLLLILGTLAVGMGWEVFEYVVGIQDTLNERIDTSVDLLMDIAGALAVSIVAITYIDKNKPHE